MKFNELLTNFDIDWKKVEKIPEFSKLKATQQSTVWHKEGSVYHHTTLVCKEMKNILVKYYIAEGSHTWVMCMMAALCHDLGKAETTKWSDEKNDWTTKNHGLVGERITRKLFSDEDMFLREEVCYMVRHHMALHHVFDKAGETDMKFIKLSHGIVPIKYMLYLNYADTRGSINDIEDEDFKKEKFDKIATKAASLTCYYTSYSFVDKSQLIRKFIGYNGDVVNDKNDFCVYILCGFPGCGKSTYIKENLPNVKVISRDIIRGELGIGGATTENDKKVVGTQEEENEVSKIFDQRMIECCEHKESFVLDNTNLKYQYRKDYLMKIMKYNPKVRIIYIEAPDMINDCIKRRENQIPKVVYNRMLSNFDFPQLFECDELLLYKENCCGSDTIIKINSNLTPTNINIEQKILTDLNITRGAMILDGYDCYDSCIKYMDDLIRKYK